MNEETKQIDDGGRDFPGEKDVRFGQANDCHEGMSVRDYFAIRALDSLIRGRSWSHLEPERLLETWSLSAYALADAMIAARNTQP